MAEFARIPHADSNLQHAPEGVDEESLMMLLDILPNGFEYSVPNGQIRPGDTVVIFGTGHLGLTALLLAQFHSPAEIIMVDTHRQCFEAATDLGATRLIHATNGDALKEIVSASAKKKIDVAIIANAKVAVNSIWRSYGQPSLPLPRVLLMPSRPTAG
jgi:alcohol dehydrogenase